MTSRAELGRAAWRVLHLMTLRFPDEPTPDQRDALKSYMHLFARLYPCGECAAEFQRLLKEYPPQVREPADVLVPADQPDVVSQVGIALALSRTQPGQRSAREARVRLSNAGFDL